MYKEFFINKQSGTYAETLEAFGVANLVNEILQRSEISGRKIIIEDKGLYYLVNSSKEITEDMINNLPYFQVIKFLIKDGTSKIPQEIARSDCFDYPAQKAILDEINDRKKKAFAIKEAELRKKEFKKVTTEQQSEFGKKIDAEFDVYRELRGNAYNSVIKLYENFNRNKNHFPDIIKEILDNYSNPTPKKRKFKLVDEKPSSQQLINPHQGQGLNKIKATGVSSTKLTSSWIAETLKILGALRIMSCQLIPIGKSGNKFDLKIYVPKFNNIQITEGIKLLTEFKRFLKSTSPVKLDIFNILDLIVRFIELTPEYKKGKVKNTIQGLHTVYQKHLGQNKAVVNIAFINTPDFVEYSNQREGKEWIEILKSQRSIISSIEEKGDSIQGLQHYRNFLGSSGNNAFEYFSRFNYWYANHLMTFLSGLKPEQDNRRAYYTFKSFKVETLNKFYKNMDTKEINLLEIIQNEGFKAVAQAIRKSTVTLQYTPKENRKFDIRYGTAQQLQNKSKSKEDLATFIGEFIGTYNAETARNAEKNGGKSFRANVKDDELIQFYALLDKHPSRLVGALLASYGFALNKKEAPQDEENLIQSEI
jgi:hypothetical protein